VGGDGADGEEGVLVVQEWREVEKGGTPRPKEPQAGKKWIQILGLQNVDAITKVMDEAVEQEERIKARQSEKEAKSTADELGEG
jgi:hypothetical protein